MAEVWTCPQCHAQWASRQGKCPQCLYGFSAQERALMLPSTVPQLIGPNGQALAPREGGTPAGSVGPAGGSSLSPQAAPVADRYQALLAGVQQMLQPIVTWLAKRGMQVEQITDAIPTMLQMVTELEVRSSRSILAPTMPQEWQARVEQLEHGMQQLALAIATLRREESAPLVPVPPLAPEQPYPSFLVEDREQAQLEQALLQAQRTRPQPWE